MAGDPVWGAATMRVCPSREGKGTCALELISEDLVSIFWGVRGREVQVSVLSDVLSVPVGDWGESAFLWRFCPSGQSVCHLL